jgi:hypothetical protein
VSQRFAPGAGPDRTPRARIFDQPAPTRGMPLGFAQAGAERPLSAHPKREPGVSKSIAMPLTKLEQQLRLIARERIANGQLPREMPPSRMWAGYGTGQSCSLCDKPIQRDEVEYEIEHPHGPVQTFRFHTVCQAIWQLECARADYLRKRA